MNKKNKLWVQPELTVLVRRKPEEGILENCKMFSGTTGWEAVNNGCFRLCSQSSCALFGDT